ncbi:MAG: chorismate mutase [Clostridia bacterium]|nr:chorismate mutase [Clostridia bacterium]MDD4145622.1 chorismate mutase [Clostridia bacterium]
MRGATTVAANTKENIVAETQKLLQAILQANVIAPEDLVSIIFTTTVDLDAEFPAKAARIMGLNNVPLLGCVEADVLHGLPLCIRILVYVYLEQGTKINHIYLNAAVKLRPDLSQDDIS